jgi:hypothetical protein
VDPDDIYFPEAEDIGPHAIAFAQVMFAHSEFEREVCSLQGVITNDPSFGEEQPVESPRAPGTYGQADQDAGAPTPCDHRRSPRGLKQVAKIVPVPVATDKQAGVADCTAAPAVVSLRVMQPPTLRVHT